MDNEYVYYNKPTPKEPIVMDEVEASRPGCILCRLDEMESWAYLDDLLP